MLSAVIFILIASDLGIAVGVDQCVYLLLGNAHGAFCGAVALVAGEVGGGEDGVYGDTVHVGYGAEQCRNAHQLAVVVFQAVDAAHYSPAGGSTGDKQQHLLAPDHALAVVTEYHLVVAVHFGGDNVDVVAVVKRAVGACGKLLGKKCTQHLRSLKAYDGVDVCGIVDTRQHLCGLLGVFVFALELVKVYIVVDVRVVGGKMSWDDTDLDLGVLAVGYLLSTVFHFLLLPVVQEFSVYLLYHIMTKKSTDLGAILGFFTKFFYYLIGERGV